MTRDEAKQILALYRPGVMVQPDAQTAEALELARRDPELAAWLEQQSAVFTEIRAKLKTIPVPPGLRRRIILEHLAHARILPLTTRLLLAAAIAALILLTAVLWFQFQPNPQNTFDGWRNRMAKDVQRGYAMQMTGTNQAEIREFFRSKGQPADYTLPARLDKLPGEGGAVKRWNASYTSLLCLDGSIKPGQRNDLYLFMAKRSGVPGAPAPGKKVFRKIGGFMTVTWTQGDELYLLTASGGEDEAALEQYLE